MGRMLKALKELEGRSPQPQPASESARPQPPDSRRQPPPGDVPPVDTGIDPQRAHGDDTAIEAALARVEIAAAAFCPQHQAPCDSPTVSWPIRSTEQHARAYRQLAQNVLSHVTPSRGAALIFTSPRGGEGKTQLVVSLAAALTERTAERVLLLDGNLHKPDLAGCLGVAAARGLAQVLVGAASWRQVVRPTFVPHLDLLPGVNFPVPDVGPPEQWNLPALLAELRSAYQLVLIDTASLAHPEVALLAGCCDGTYLVVRLSHTTQRDLAKAVELIRSCRGRLLGGVVIGD
jgi:Mrp family chromosome partitioning ATPase